MDCGVTPYSVVKEMLSLRLLLTVALAWKTLGVTEGAKHQMEEVEVGGNVTFRCTENTRQSIKMMYLQRGGEFVNGFYASKTIKRKTWPNTRLDQIRAAVHMFNLNVSHEGNYTCLIEFNGSEDIHRIPISLRIKAPYSKPSISMQCSNDSCLVECESHSGYPSAKLKWNIISNSSQVCKSEDSNELSRQNTQLFNASLTAVFNCSATAETHISCSIRDSISDPFTICDAQDPPPIKYIVIGLCCAGVCLLLVGVVGWWVHRNRKTKRLSGISAEDAKTPSKDNEEGVPLTVVTS